MPIEGSYFDGVSARRHVVFLDAAQGGLRLTGASFAREALPGEFTLPGKLGNTPRLILFADGARCEVTDDAGLEQLLAEAGIESSLLGHLESRWSFALVALLITLTLVAVTYVWGLPYAAEHAAYRVPGQLLTTIDTQFIKAVDGRLLEPSKLPEDRQRILSDRLHRMLLPAGIAPPTEILYRSSPRIGPNALALPGGSIVILDEIVALTSDDDEIMAVLAHEMGHVAERHALRQMLQASVVGLAMAWYVGDISSVLAAAPATLLETSYSRDFERRADAFGAQLLVSNQLPPSRLADMFEKLERAHNKNASDKRHEAMNYLSTHPDTAERIRTLRALP